MNSPPQFTGLVWRDGSTAMRSKRRSAKSAAMAAAEEAVALPPLQQEPLLKIQETEQRALNSSLHHDETTWDMLNQQQHLLQTHKEDHKNLLKYQDFVRLPITDRIFNNYNLDWKGILKEYPYIIVEPIKLNREEYEKLAQIERWRHIS